MPIKKQIVFIESSSSPYFFKLARALRKKNYEPVLIILMGDVNIEYNKQAFDKIISLNSKFMKADLRNLPKIIAYSASKFKDIFGFFMELKKLKPYVVIGRATPSWTFVLFKHFFRKYPFIYFPYDIRSFNYKDLKQAKKAGVPKFEIKAEKYCFENADGIMHKGDENELKYLNKNLLGDVKINSPILHFPPYCLKEFIVPINKNKVSKKDKEIHLVFIGHVVTHPEKKESSWEEPIKDILNQKMHLHLYGRSINVTDEDFKKNFYNSYLAQFLKNRYFHLHPQFPPKELIKEISKYDFGIWMGYWFEKGYNIKFASGNRLASNLEAGLPIVYYRNHEFVDKIMKSYGLQLAVDPKDYKNLKKILKKINYKEYIKKIEKARKDFEIENNLPKFEKFIEKVHNLKLSKL